jgi:hypothetical protein
MVAASVALLGSAAACSDNGGGNPLASVDEPAIPEPRDTSAMAPGTPPITR